MIMIYEYESYDLLIYIIYDICYIYNRVALPFSRVSVQFPATIWQKLLDSHPFSLIQCWLQVCLSFLVSTPCRSFFRLGPTLRQEGDGIFGILKQFKYFYEIWLVKIFLPLIVTKFHWFFIVFQVQRPNCVSLTDYEVCHSGWSLSGSSQCCSDDYSNILVIFSDSLNSYEG